MMGHSMRILLVDDQPLFLEALCNLLRTTWTEGEFVSHTSAAAGVEEGRGQTFDVALVNAEALDASGLGPQAYGELGAPLILTSSSFDASILSEAINAGARGYIPKTTGSRAIVGAVEVVSHGGVCYPSEALAVLAGAKAPAPRIGASRRELEILQRIEQGSSNKVIARELGLSLATVKFHVQSILRATGARNRVEAIINARRMGMLPRSGLV